MFSVIKNDSDPAERPYLVLAWPDTPSTLQVQADVMDAICFAWLPIRAYSCRTTNTTRSKEREGGKEKGDERVHTHQPVEGRPICPYQVIPLVTRIYIYIDTVCWYSTYERAVTPYFHPVGTTIESLILASGKDGFLVLL